jgi:hypothetical protein
MTEEQPTEPKQKPITEQWDDQFAGQISQRFKHAALGNISTRASYKDLENFRKKFNTHIEQCVYDAIEDVRFIRYSHQRIVLNKLSEEIDKCDKAIANAKETLESALILEIANKRDTEKSLSDYTHMKDGLKKAMDHILSTTPKEVFEILSKEHEERANIQPALDEATPGAIQSIGNPYKEAEMKVSI